MANELLVSLTIGAALSSSFLAAFSSAGKTLNMLGQQSENLTHLHRRMGRDLSSAVAQPFSNLSKMKSHYDKIGQSIKNLNQTQIALNASIAKGEYYSQKRQEIRGQFGEAAGLSLASYGIASTIMRSYLSSEEAATNLKISMMKADGTFGQFEEIAKIANQLGTELPGTTADFYNLAKALKQQGISEDVIKNGALKTSAKLNVLLGMDQEQGGEFLAKYMEAHGLKENELANAADSLQKAMYASGLSKDQMYEAMKYYAPKVNNMGLTGAENTQKILAIEGLAASQGLEGSSFGTAFNNFLGEMSLGLNSVKTASKGDKAVARDYLEQSGVELAFYDKKGEFIGIDAAMKQMDQLKKVQEKFGAEGLTTVTEAIWGKEGGRIADILVQKGSQGLQEQLKKMEQQAELHERIKQKTATLGAALESLGGVWDNLLGTIGSAFADDIKAFAETAQNFIENTLQPWLEQNKGLVKSVGAVILGLMVGRVAFIAFRYVWVSFFSLVNAGSTVLKVFSAQWHLLGAVLKVVRGQYGLLTGLMRMGLPIGNIIKITNKIKNLSSFMRLASMFNLLKNGALMLGRALAGGVAKGMMFVGRAILFIGRSLLMTPIGLIIAGIALAGFLIYKYWKPIKAFFVGVGQGIRKALEPLQPIFDGISASLSKIWSVVEPYVQPIIDWFKDFFNVSQQGEGSAQSFGEAIGTWIGDKIAWLVDKVYWVWDSINNLFGGGIAGVLAKLMTFSPAGLFMMAISGLINIASTVWEQIKTVFGNAIENLKAKISNFSPSALFQRAFDSVAGVFSGLSSRFTTWGQNIVQGLVNGIQSKIATVKAKLSEMASLAKISFTAPVQIKSPSRVFMRYGRDLVDGLTIGVDRQQHKALASSQQLGQGVMSAFLPQQDGKSEFKVAFEPLQGEVQRATSVHTAQQASINVHFNPIIHADAGQQQSIQTAMKMSLHEFEQMLKRVQQQQQRRSYV